MWSRKDESFKMDSKREKFENQRENRYDLKASNAMSSDTHLSNKSIMAETEDMDSSLPGIPIVSTIGSDNVELSWTESGNELDYYQIRYKSKNEKDIWKYVTTDRNKITITGLMAATSYVFQVRAVFKDQEGKYGPQSNGVITSESSATKLRKSSKLVKEGNPSIYRLKGTELKHSRNPTAKTRKFEFGIPIQATLEKTIMLVGETGSGKTTLVDGIVNYVTGISFDDPFRFTIVQPEEDKEETIINQAISKTKWITAYKIFPAEGSRLRYTLSIIDTPGFGDTTRGIEGDTAIVDQIRHLFCAQGDQGVYLIKLLSNISRNVQLANQAMLYISGDSALITTTLNLGPKFFIYWNAKDLFLKT